MHAESECFAGDAGVFYGCGMILTMPLPFPELLPELKEGEITLSRLLPKHRDSLMNAMQDPEIWSMHSWTDQWQPQIAMKWIDTAFSMGRCYVILKNGKIVGSSRFYDLCESNVSIGFSFFVRSEWGSGLNGIVKSMMLRLAFAYVPQVLFKVDELNMRSRHALMKIGAVEVDEIPNHVQRSDGSWRKTVIYSISRDLKTTS